MLIHFCLSDTVGSWPSSQGHRVCVQWVWAGTLQNMEWTFGSTCTNKDSARKDSTLGDWEVRCVQPAQWCNHQHVRRFQHSNQAISDMEGSTCWYPSPFTSRVTIILPGWDTESNVRTWPVSLEEGVLSLPVTCRWMHQYSHSLSRWHHGKPATANPRRKFRGQLEVRGHLVNSSRIYKHYYCFYVCNEHHACTYAVPTVALASTTLSCIQAASCM